MRPNRAANLSGRTAAAGLPNQDRKAGLRNMRP